MKIKHSEKKHGGNTDSSFLMETSFSDLNFGITVNIRLFSYKLIVLHSFLIYAMESDRIIKSYNFQITNFENIKVHMGIIERNQNPLK